MPNNHILAVSFAGEFSAGRFGRFEVRTASRLLAEAGSRSRLASEFVPAGQGISRAGTNGSATTSWSAQP
jgi:hypothetical protein